jgi:hypothetical protein
VGPVVAGTALAEVGDLQRFRAPITLLVTVERLRWREGVDRMPACRSILVGIAA